MRRGLKLGMLLLDMETERIGVVTLLYFAVLFRSRGMRVAMLTLKALER